MLWSVQGFVVVSFSHSFLDAYKVEQKSETKSMSVEK